MWDFLFSKRKSRPREMEEKKKKTGWAQTTFAQVVHYCSERTVTCEEISGIGPEHEARGRRTEIKEERERKWKKIKKE